MSHRFRRLRPQHSNSARPTRSIGETITFIDQSTGSPTNWTWSFGDETGSTEQNPTHSYAAEGTYAVRLSVSNPDGADFTTMDITVHPDDEPVLTELVFVPAAANATGSGGSIWVTTLDVHNPGATAAFYRILWLPRNADNSTPTESELYTLDPGESKRFQNVLADVFNLSNASGAVSIISDSEDIEAMSRTFNQSDNGTFGQSLPGVPVDELDSCRRTRAYPLPDRERGFPVQSRLRQRCR